MAFYSWQRRLEHGGQLDARRPAQRRGGYGDIPILDRQRRFNLHQYRNRRDHFLSRGERLQHHRQPDLSVDHQRLRNRK